MPNKPLHPLWPDVPIKPSYSVRELSRYLGVPRSTLQLAINEGRLTIFRISPRCHRSPLESVRALLESTILDPYA